MNRPVIGVMDSGLGLVGFADALHEQMPDADLVLAMDPDHAPYGRLTPAQVTERALASAACLARWNPDAIVVACNTASVHALGALRARYEGTGAGGRRAAAGGSPGSMSESIPVVGTVPAIKVAAARRAPFAVWATTATTHSDYQRGLIRDFVTSECMNPGHVFQVACPGLSHAIDTADPDAIDAAILAGAAATPDDVENIVLGCTHYGLVADRILRLRPQTRRLFDSPIAVARQTAHRLGRPEAAGTKQSARDRRVPGASETEDATADAAPAAKGAAASQAGGAGISPTGGGAVTPSGRILAAYQSGRVEPLPAALAAYPAGRRLLALQNPV